MCAGEGGQVVDLAIENRRVIDTLTIVDDITRMTCQTVTKGISSETETREQDALESISILC